MIPHLPDQFVAAARKHGLRGERLEYGASIECPVCQNGREVILKEEFGIVDGQCRYCGSFAIDMALELVTMERRNGKASQPPAAAPSRRETVRPLRLYSTADLAAMPAPVWLVEPYIIAGGLTVIYGAAGSFKTFISIDWAARAGGAVYIAAEGSPGNLYKRAHAWEEAARRPAAIHWLPQPVDLLDRSHVGALCAAVTAVEPKPTLLVIDTAARSMAGDENSTADMGGLIAATDRLRSDLGVAVVLVHHSGHNNKDRERGSSALRAAADISIRAKPAGPMKVRLECAKMRDGEPFEPHVITLEPTAGSLVAARSATPSENVEQEVRDYLTEHPDASQRQVEEAISGYSRHVREAYKRVRLSAATPVAAPHGPSAASGPL